MAVDDSASGSSDVGSEGSAVRPRTLPPDVAFKIIGNKTRLAILDTLWGPEAPGTMTFTGLRKAVDMRDGSQFNFHLQKLVDGGFIEKVDGRYVIRQAGARVISTVRTGYLTDHPEIEAFETTGRCYGCDAPLEARYDDEMFFVECPVCDRLHTRMWFPPSGLRDRVPTEALRAAEHAMRASIDLAIAGICPICNGATERTLSCDPSEVPVRSAYVDPDRDGAVSAWYVCSTCSAWVTASPGDSVVTHPAVVGLYHQHGIDIRSCPQWQLPWTMDTTALEVVSTDPFRVRLSVVLEGEELILTLDGAFDVVSVE